MKPARPWLLVAFISMLAGCSAPPAPTNALVLATTTSTQDSGLLDLLVPMFREQSGIEVKVVAVGTGQALQLGRRGDADVLLVHDPAAEEKFMTEGHGLTHQPVMYNDFILVGPPGDPARVKGVAAVTAAFAQIRQHSAPFISRGDESGTHQRERRIWGTAKIEPQGDWYIQAGAGMAQILYMADQKRAYTLVNQYSVIVVSPEAHRGVRVELARRFAAFLLDPATQMTIAEFGRDRFGQSLFFPGRAGK
jgi:tungstate transport system substrate-binding protein